MPAPVLAQNLLRIAAVVNDDIISVVDIDQRLRITALSSGINLDAKTRERLLPQVLRSLIDERLQLQHATENSIRVNARNIDKRIAEMARSNNIAADQLAGFLAQRGIDIESLRLQVETELAWQTYVQRRLIRQTQVTDEDVDEEIARRERVANLPQKRVSEIFLSTDSPDQLPGIVQDAERLLSQVRNGANFAALAQNFSQSATARNGGDLGWVSEGQLPEELNAALRDLVPGTVSAPIRTLTGVFLLYVRAERAGTPGLVGEESIDIAQLTVLISKANEPDTYAQRKQALASLAPTIASCDALSESAKQIPGSSIARANEIQLSQLPANVRIPVSSLADNGTTQPIETPAGLVLITRCGGSGPKGPDRDLVFRQLLGKQLERLAQRTLRDLRRDAFIDVRL